MLKDAHVERADLQNRLRAVDRLIAALDGMDGETAAVAPTTESSADTYPKPREAVARAVRELQAGRPVEPREITEIVRRLGLFNPGLKSGATAYTTALSRLAEDANSEIRRQGDFYVLRPRTGQDAEDRGVPHDDK